MWTRVLQFLKEPTGAALAKGSLVVLVFKVIGALGGYVLLFSLAKAGGELSVGVYEVAFTVLVIGSTMGRWGLDTVLVREMSREAKSGGLSRSLYIAVFFRVTAITSLVALALFFGASFLTNLFFEDTPKEILATAAIAILPFTLMLLNAEVFRAIGKTILFSINQHGTIYIVIAALLWWIPLPEAMAFADTAQFALILLLGLSALFFIVSTIYILSLSATEVLINQPWKGQLFKIATPMLISSSLFLVISWSDTLMLGYFLPEERVGLYRIVFKVATLITFAQFALNTVVAPMVSAIHRDRSKLHELAHKVAQLNLITSGPVFVVILLFGTSLIGIFGVSDPSEAYPWLVVLAFGQLTNAFSGPVLNILNMTGYEKSARNTMLVVAVLNITLNALLIPAYGPLGAAYSTTLTMVGWNVWAASLVYKYHGVIAVPFLTKYSRKND